MVVRTEVCIYKLMKAISVPDLFAIVMGLCAIGLIVIPELVYVRDIYENGTPGRILCLS